MRKQAYLTHAKTLGLLLKTKRAYTKTLQYAAERREPTYNPEVHGKFSELADEAAEQFGRSWDSEQKNGMGHGIHDKYLAMAQISHCGVCHRYTDEEFEANIDTYIEMTEEFMDMAEDSEQEE